MVLLQHFGATSGIEKAKWERIATKIGSLKPRAATTLAGKQQQLSDQAYQISKLNNLKFKMFNYSWWHAKLVGSALHPRLWGATEIQNKP
jgi:hypothetical protein